MKLGICDEEHCNTHCPLSMLDDFAGATPRYRFADTSKWFEQNRRPFFKLLERSLIEHNNPKHEAL